MKHGAALVYRDRSTPDVKRRAHEQAGSVGKARGAMTDWLDIVRAHEQTKDLVRAGDR